MTRPQVPAAAKMLKLILQNVEISVAMSIVYVQCRALLDHVPYHPALCTL